MSLKIFRTATLPVIGERVANALYLTRDTNSGELVIHATNNDNTAVFNNITAAQVAAMIDAGTSATADALTTARNITATGDASWTVSFDGSGNVSAALTLANSGAAAGEYSNITVDAKGRVTSIRAINGADIGRGAANGVASLDGAGLVPATQLPSYVDDVIEVDAYDKLPGEVNDPGTNGVASAGKIYVVVEGGTTSIYRWSGTTYIEIPTGVGLADSALKLETARNISITGDATWTVSFDGTGNVSAALTLANSGVTAGVYNNIEVDAKGRVIDARALEATDIPELTYLQVASARELYVEDPEW
jgi:hypothetical protein